MGRRVATSRRARGVGGAGEGKELIVSRKGMERAGVAVGGTQAYYTNKRTCLLCANFNKG